jgi:hypothetical protein
MRPAGDQDLVLQENRTMSFRIDDLMVSVLPQGQGDDEDVDQECGGSSTRPGGGTGGTGGTKASDAELALLQAQLRQALEAQG